MRISFDIDDTLVCLPEVPHEVVVPWWWRWRFTERLRQGTRGLLRELQSQQHELWIYTTSYRPARYLYGWFGSLGVRLKGVVNQTRHEQVVGLRGPSKLPRAFGIHLHVDDSPGVAEEGRLHGFQVLVIRPDDDDWTSRVRSAVNERR